MDHYKLMYFDARGSAEVIRQIFVLAGHKYEDKRVTAEEWAKMKYEMPFEQLPVLEVNGKRIGQSFAIVRYLARQFGYTHRGIWEAVVDMIGEQFRDYLTEISPFVRVLMGLDEGDKDAMMDDFLASRNKFFTYVTEFLNESKSGYLVGDSVTWPDLYLAETAEFAFKIPKYYEGFPEVYEHAQKIRSIPRLQKWRATRPETDF